MGMQPHIAPPLYICEREQKDSQIGGCGVKGLVASLTVRRMQRSTEKIRKNGGRGVKLKMFKGILHYF